MPITSLLGACDLNELAPILNLSRDIHSFADIHNLTGISSALHDFEKALIAGKLTGTCAHPTYIHELRDMAESIADKFLNTAAIYRLSPFIQSELKLGLSDLAAKANMHFLSHASAAASGALTKAGPLTEQLFLGKLSFL
jgi:hypothetical protein